jgi:hypothetical protein
MPRLSWRTACKPPRSISPALPSPREHQGQEYRLRLTRNDKLILNK